MPDHKIYNSLVIPGAMLKPGFSVYLFVIAAKAKKYYYVGMTGDGFYPSARSAIHRLSGHFEKKNNSTQNQIWRAIKEYNLKDSIDSVEMYHFPIKGFYPLLNTKKVLRLSELSDKQSTEYKEKRKAVHDFEEHLISEVRRIIKQRCLNKTKESAKATEYTVDTAELKEIKDKLLELVI